jgi:hypothetical protein
MEVQRNPWRRNATLSNARNALIGSVPGNAVSCKVKTGGGFWRPRSGLRVVICGFLWLETAGLAFGREKAIFDARRKCRRNWFRLTTEPRANPARFRRLGDLFGFCPRRRILHGGAPFGRGLNGDAFFSPR